MSAITYYYDFGSPNAWLSHQVIPAIEARSGARFEYVPILLGGLFKMTGNQSPVQAFAGVRNKLAYQQRESERFMRKHAITTFKMNPHFPVNTLAIMRGAVAAESLGVAPAYIDLMFSAMWEQGLKMDDPEVIRDVLVKAGLDAEKLMALTGEADIKAKLLANTEQAFNDGAFGSPSFVVNGELFFGKDKLADVEEWYRAGG